MSYMFENAISFNRDLSLWEVGHISSCNAFDDGAILWTLPKPNFTSCSISP